MARTIGAQIGLFAFAVAIIAGVAAGNSATTILMRAVIVMFVAATCGQLAGWAAKVILRDELQKRKSKIDRLHVELISQELEDADLQEQDANATDTDTSPQDDGEQMQSLEDAAESDAQEPVQAG